jgi:hypothetical protein
MTRRMQANTREEERGSAPSGDAGASGRAVSIGRVIDRLCRAPGTYQITVVVPVHRRSPWQITYARVEAVRKETVGRKGVKG